MTFKELEDRMPFGATVTWKEFAALVSEATSVHVGFYAVTNDPKDGLVGRAIEISKSTALVRARQGQACHPNDERVNVYACAGSLYFGGK